MDRNADRRPASPGPWLRNGDRDVAAWLAQGQPLDCLTPRLAVAAPDDELAACLLQEAVRRHGDLGSIAEAVGLAHRLRDAGHPLGHLPLRLLETERWYAPERRLKPQHLLDGYTAPYEPRPRPTRAAGGPSDLELAGVEVGWPTAGQARQAFPDYLIESEGEAESRRYLLDRPLAPAAFGASTLLRLAPDCLSGTRPQQVRAWRAEPHDVWAVLYEQSLWGGPYQHGRGAAYSRAAAWEAFAALCDAAGELGDIERAAAECTWLLFEADSAWYMQVNDSLDVGIAGLWPDHQTVVLLAATDSD